MISVQRTARNNTRPEEAGNQARDDERLAPELAEVARRTSSPRLNDELPRVLPFFRLMFLDGALFTEDGVPSRW